MAATETLREFYELAQSRSSVITLYGYGISVRVDRGHLILEDGTGADRHGWRLPRVGHGLRRLVVVGTEGCISLAAFRWLEEQKISFAMLERDGTLLAFTGPTYPSDSRLRRAQAVAHINGVAVTIARDLIARKLGGQRDVALTLKDEHTAEVIAQYRESLASAKTITEIRTLEARAAAAYWQLWTDVPVRFRKQDDEKTAQHWKAFGTRQSPLSGSPRVAANPANAMLNLLYKLAEVEVRVAVNSVGLDPGLAFIHADEQGRDSLVYDLLEPLRPLVDSYLLRWLSVPLHRTNFFELGTGQCRLMAKLCTDLCRSMPLWERAAKPIARQVALTLWESASKSARRTAPLKSLGRAKSGAELRRALSVLLGDGYR